MIETDARFLRVLLVASVGLSFSVLAGTLDKLTLLDTMKSELTTARRLPAGSRPAPPQGDLSSLEGVSATDVLRKLGRPTNCEPGGPHKCGHSTSIVYEWGPRALTPRTQKHGENEVVTITIGGPFLLVLDLERGLVKSARWQGQR